MKKKLVGTSWKMNKTLSEALAFCHVLKSGLSKEICESIQPFVIPPFTTVRDVSLFINENQINCLTGVQNMHFADQGAYTGEISPLMVKDTGAVLVELGHSERRRYFAETDLMVNKKVHAAINHGLKPLVCVGDEAQEKEWGVSVETVVKQMKAAIAGLSAAQVENVIIAYEPVWAIGEHGIPATTEEAEVIHAALRQALITCYGEQVANKISILYGGSVNLQNSVELITQPNIDGLFIGRSAWSPEGYCEILSTISRIIRD